MPKAYVAVLAHGGLLPCSERDLYDRKSRFYQRVRPCSFMRIGRYSVVIGESDLAVFRSYTDEDTADAIEQRGEYAVSRKYADESLRDRKSQIQAMRAAFRRLPASHPMQGLVEHDARLELAAQSKRSA